MIYELYVRERNSNTVKLGSRELGLEVVVSNGNILMITKGLVKGLKIQKPYHLKKQDAKTYKVSGTRFTLRHIENLKVGLYES